MNKKNEWKSFNFGNRIGEDYFSFFWLTIFRRRSQIQWSDSSSIHAKKAQAKIIHKNPQNQWIAVPRCVNKSWMEKGVSKRQWQRIDGKKGPQIGPNFFFHFFPQMTGCWFNDPCVYLCTVHRVGKNRNFSFATLSTTEIGTISSLRIAGCTSHTIKQKKIDDGRGLNTPKRKKSNRILPTLQCIYLEIISHSRVQKRTNAN